jgi:hypothetical protein
MGDLYDYKCRLRSREIHPGQESGLPLAKDGLEGHSPQDLWKQNSLVLLLAAMNISSIPWNEYM